jgi:hypothetical protein
MSTPPSSETVTAIPEPDAIALIPVTGSEDAPSAGAVLEAAASEDEVDGIVVADAASSTGGADIPFEDRQSGLPAWSGQACPGCSPLSVPRPHLELIPALVNQTHHPPLVQIRHLSRTPSSDRRFLTMGQTPGTLAELIPPTSVTCTRPSRRRAPRSWSGSWRKRRLESRLRRPAWRRSESGFPHRERGRRW